MAKKLVFDRTLWVIAKTTMEIYVPEGEVWKFCASDNDYINPTYPIPYERIVGGGAKIKATPKDVCFSGIAFKIVEE